MGIIGYKGETQQLGIIPQDFHKLASKSDSEISLVQNNFQFANLGIGSDEKSDTALSEGRSVAVAFTGIIENYQEALQFLADEGIIIKSESDVLPNLIQYFLQDGEDFREAFRQSLLKLEGSFATVALHQGYDILLFAKKGMPLIVGVGENDSFIISEEPQTNRVIHLEDNEYGIIDSDVQVFTINTNKKLEKGISEIILNKEKKQSQEKAARQLFGTDGIRGVANEYPMTPEMALRIGRAIVHVLGKSGKGSIVLGKDTRLSGYMLENALSSGIVSSGFEVYFVGPMPTPAIAHLTKSLNCTAGIVLSASHNPAEDNGIKLFDSEGFKLPDVKEEEIEKIALSPDIDSGKYKGKIAKAYRIDDAKGRYIEYAKATVGSLSLKGIKIVLDCANGAAYHIAPDIFRELGAEVIALNSQPDGLNINLNCGATHPEVIQAKVKESGADIGLALDGDADRIIICDENGNLVDGDKILVMLALDMIEKNQLNHNTLVVTDYSNLGVDQAIKAKSGKVVRTQNGDRYVIEEMRKNEFSLGGEKSGHIIFRKHSTTGDGIITSLQVLRLIKESGKKISVLADCMKEYPQVFININVKEKKDFAKMPRVFSAIKEAELKLQNKGRLLVRYSGTQNMCRIMLEGEDKNLIKMHAEQIASALNKEVGI